MDEQEKQNEKDKGLRKILTDLIDNVRKGERENFTKSLNPAMKEMQDVLDKQEQINTDIKLNNFRNKTVLLSFNGALIALMVGSSDKISYSLMPFLVLFFSFSMGIMQMIIFYLKNEYLYIKAKVLGDKCKAVFKFCQKHKNDPRVIVDTQAFINNEVFEIDKDYKQIPHLLKDFERGNNILKIFIKTLSFELLFYIPLLIGFGQVIYALYRYLTKIV